MKRIIKRLLIVVCCWYGAVIFFLPSITHCGDWASTLVVHSGIDQFAREVCQGDRRFDDFDLSSFENWRYRARFVSSDDDPKFAVVVYPELPWKYHYGFLNRMLSLDWGKRGLPVVILTQEGNIYSCRRRDYTFKNIPPDSILQLVDTNKPGGLHPWIAHQSVNGPCVAIDENSKTE